jgi:putative transcriptional regulator
MKHNKLKALRVEHGLTQTQMAKLIGIGLTSYNNKENGKLDFNITEIEKIKKIFGKSYEEIFFNQPAHDTQYIA